MPAPSRTLIPGVVGIGPARAATCRHCARIIQRGDQEAIGTTGKRHWYHRVCWMFLVRLGVAEHPNLTT